jgi:hypothetical protein
MTMNWQERIFPWAWCCRDLMFIDCILVENLKPQRKGMLDDGCRCIRHVESGPSFFYLVGLQPTRKVTTPVPCQATPNPPFFFSFFAVSSIEVHRSYLFLIIYEFRVNLFRAVRPPPA